MASTYSSNLKIELIGTGEQTNTWGNTTNTNLGTALEEAIVGYGNPNFSSDADLTISITNSASSQVARNFVLNVTSSLSLTSTWNLIVPTIEKPYVVQNNTTGGQSIVVKTSGGTGVTVPNGKSVFVYADGLNVVSAINHVPSLTLGAALPVASGGTGLTSPGTSGNVLTSNGTAWTSTAIPASFSTGMIMLWSGSIASIPSGWALCDGTNGTPNLQNRFVVGAGDTYSVDGTGGSADAIVVEHTHTATSTVTDPGHVHTYATFISTNPANSGGGSAQAPTTGTTNSNTTGITVATTIDSQGTSGTNANLPPYYALAYIMKL